MEEEGRILGREEDCTAWHGRKKGKGCIPVLALFSSILLVAWRVEQEYRAGVNFDLGITQPRAMMSTACTCVCVSFAMSQAYCRYSK